MMQQRETSGETRNNMRTIELAQAVLHVMEYLNRKDVKHIRLVSLAFNEAFKVSKELKYFKFVIDGNNISECKVAMSYLMTTSVAWESVIFRNINLTDEEETFGRIIPKIRNVKILKFINCTMNSLLLTQTGAQMSQLNSLSIVSCPLFLHINPEEVIWTPLVSRSINCLNYLKCLRLDTAVLTVHMIELFLSESDNLEYINLKSTEVALPHNIFKIIAKKRNTLKILKLRGQLCVTEEGLTSLKQLNLRFLSFDKLTISTEINFSYQFLTKQSQLSRLVFKNMKFTWYIFFQIYKLDNLKQVEFLNCDFVDGLYPCLIGFQRVKTLEVIAIKNSKYENILQLATIFEAKPYGVVPILNTVKLTGVFGAILEHIYINFENLKCLELYSAKLTIYHLQCIWRMNKLLKLVIRHCALSDIEMNNSKPCTIYNLTELKHLDLSHTNIGDDTVMKYIINLQRLQCLMLSNTKITNKSLDFIKLTRGTNLQNLMLIEFYDCPSCLFISEEDSHRLEIDMKPIKLYYT